MKQTALDKKLIKELNAKIKALQTQLVKAKVVEGKDDYIDVKVKKNQGRFKKITKKNEDDKATGNFYFEIAVTAKQSDVFFPISIASGKKTTGFMYQIEGTAASSIVSTSIKVQGEGVSQVTLGTLRYAKIPTGKTASFKIQVTIGGKFNKQYKIILTRLNYRLLLTDARYQQYLKRIESKSVRFS